MLIIDRTAFRDIKPSETAQYVAKIRWYQKNRCFYCNRFMRERKTKVGAPRACHPTKDHFLPKKKGFKSILGNCVVACMGCNSRAQHTLPSFSEIVRMMKMHEDLNLPCVFKFMEKQGTTLDIMMENL